MESMHRSFARQGRYVLGKAEEVYHQRYATEALTTQVAALPPNPTGGGIFATFRRCGLGYRGVSNYAPSAAARTAAKMLAAIGTAIPSELS